MGTRKEEGAKHHEGPPERSSPVLRRLPQGQGDTPPRPITGAGT